MGGGPLTPSEETCSMQFKPTIIAPPSPSEKSTNETTTADSKKNTLEEIIQQYLVRDDHELSITEQSEYAIRPHQAKASGTNTVHIPYTSTCQSRSESPIITPSESENNIPNHHNGIIHNPNITTHRAPCAHQVHEYGCTGLRCYETAAMQVSRYGDTTSWQESPTATSQIQPQSGLPHRETGHQDQTMERLNAIKASFQSKLAVKPSHEDALANVNRVCEHDRECAIAYDGDAACDQYRDWEKKNLWYDGLIWAAQPRL